MKYLDLIEMPVVGFHKNFDDPNSEGRFKDQDRKYISNQNYKDIIYKRLQYIPFDLYIYLIDTKNTRDNIPLATDSDGYDNTDKRYYSLFYNLSDQNHLDELSQLQIHEIIKNYKSNKNAVHLVICHNDPAAVNWKPLTPWMIIHRLGHACLDINQKAEEELSITKEITSKWYNEFVNKSYLDNELGDDHFGNTDQYIIRQLLNTKSSKQYLDMGECLIEMFASYCFNCHISFRSPEEDLNDDEMNDEIQIKICNNASNIFNPLFAELINELKGKVWIG